MVSWSGFRQNCQNYDIDQRFEFPGDVYTFMLRDCQEASKDELVKFSKPYIAPEGRPAQLRTLDLAGSLMNPNAMKGVLGVARASSALTGLYLSRNRIGNDEGLLSCVVQLSGSLRNLRQLNLENIELNEEVHANSLLRGFTQVPNNLTHVYLSYNRGFGDCSTDVLSNWLRESPNLREVSMRHCDLSFQHLEALSRSFLPNGVGANTAKVSYVDLSGNERIGQECGRYASLGSDRVKMVLNELNRRVNLNLEDCGIDSGVYGMHLVHRGSRQLVRINAPEGSTRRLHLIPADDTNAIVPYRSGPNSMEHAAIAFSPGGALVRRQAGASPAIVQEPLEQFDEYYDIRTNIGFDARAEEWPYAAPPLLSEGSTGVVLSRSQFRANFVRQSSDLAQLRHQLVLRSNELRNASTAIAASRYMPRLDPSIDNTLRDLQEQVRQLQQRQQESASQASTTQADTQGQAERQLLIRELERRQADLDKRQAKLDEQQADLKEGTDMLAARDRSLQALQQELINDRNALEAKQ